MGEGGVVPHNILVPILRDNNTVCQNYMKNEKKNASSTISSVFLFFLTKLLQFTRLCEKKKKNETRPKEKREK